MAGTNEGAIRVRAARVHNLRAVDVDLPHNRLVVLTGLSGSGKSSLAFDTIHAESQRRFLETVSSFTRQLVEQLEPPDVDEIEGLPATVAVDQKCGAPNPRSTVATVTELHDFLRLLYARVGLPHCPKCGRAIACQTPEQMQARILSWPTGLKLILLAPLARRKKGENAGAFAAIRRAGLIRARIDGVLCDILDAPPRLEKGKAHTIDAVVDRLVLREGIEPRLSEGIDRALKLSGGTLVAAVLDSSGETTDHFFNAFLACAECGLSVEPLEPSSFSFNTPTSACPVCRGLGTVESFDASLLIPDDTKSLDRGAVAAIDVLPAAVARSFYDDEAFKAFLAESHITGKRAVANWPARARRALLHGQDGEAGGFPGVIAWLEARYAGLTRAGQRALAPFRSIGPCVECGGGRLNAEARAVTVGDLNMPELLAKDALGAREFLGGLRFEGELEAVGEPIVEQALGRLDALIQLGLGYLTLDRPADTLSGGELQRVRLASHLGSGLVGVCYVLDEPTAGLHPRDTEKLLRLLEALRDAGNSVVVVEHDELVIRAADWVIDLGPGAGPDGGRVVAAGRPDELDGAESQTARWLRAGWAEPSAPSERLGRSKGEIAVFGATERNLKSIDVRFPLGTIVCVTGVSGSGKSSLVQDVLGRAAHRLLYTSGAAAGSHGKIVGLELIDKLVSVDQAPLGRGPRSTPASYTGVFDEIRRVFASTREAKTRGFKSSRFSFNAKGGRCESCLGQGLRRLEMTFGADLFVPCDVCEGTRYNRATLDVKFKAKSIADVLGMRVDEALPFFEAIPQVHRGLVAMHEAGLGYVTLGQSSNTLSGGESQRIKLAAELGKKSTGRTLYLLDEPTTGLHAHDVKALQAVLENLANLGNTVVLIEHNLDMIRAADWVIDLGPEGGAAGGELVAMGTPAQVEASDRSETGRCLREARERSESK